MYYTTLQYKLDAKHQYAQTLAVALDMDEGGATLKSSMNTSLCWHLSAEAAGTLLCLAVVPCEPTSLFFSLHPFLLLHPLLLLRGGLMSAS